MLKNLKTKSTKRLGGHQFYSISKSRWGINKIENSSSALYHAVHVKIRIQSIKSSNRIKGDNKQVGILPVSMIKQQKKRKNNIRSTMRREAGVAALSVVAVRGPAVDDGWMLDDGDADSAGAGDFSVLPIPAAFNGNSTSSVPWKKKSSEVRKSKYPDI